MPDVFAFNFHCNYRYLPRSYNGLLECIDFCVYFARVIINFAFFNLKMILFNVVHFFMLISALSEKLDSFYLESTHNNMEILVFIIRDYHSIF